MEHAENRVKNQSQELENLRKKNDELERLHPILQFYGTRAKVVASFDLKKEVGSTLTIGSCPRAPCLIFRIQAIRDNRVYLGVGGVWEGMRTIENIGPSGDPFIFQLPLKKGCRIKLEASRYTIDFVIEDDRVWDLRAGIGISVAPSLTEGFKLVGSACP